MRAPARWLLRITAPPDRAEAMVGDLEEEHALLVARRGHRAALRRYWLQALGSVAPNIATRLRRWRGVRSRAAEHAAEEREGTTMTTLLQDVRYGLRSVLRHPSFAGTIVLTLCLGIAANATIFGVVNGLILSPFPFPEPDRVVGVGTAYPLLGEDLGFWENLSTHEFLDVREGARTLEDVVAWDMGNRQIDGEGPPRNVFAAFWWGDPLRTVGMEPQLGRGFTDEEIRSGAPVAMVSHRLWVSRFGADSSMVGGALSVNGSPHTLVGVVPEGVLIYGTDLWTPMPMGPTELPRNRRQFQILARVAEGADLEEVNVELEALARRVEADHAAEFEEYRGWRMEARPWAAVNSATFRVAGFLLMGAVALVLLLVCANVANLLLARSSRRRREMAVRRAMGAGRVRLLRQLLTESTVLALLGGASGLALSLLGVRGVQAFLDGLGIPFIAGRAEVDGTVVAFTLAVALAAGIVFGIVPALRAASTDPQRDLRAGDRGSAGAVSGLRFQQLFVALEVTLALTLLAGGGLLANSLVRLSRVDPGVAADEVLSMRLTLPAGRYDPEGIRVFFRELADRTGRLPAVTSAAAASQIPPLGFMRSRIEVEGSRPDAEGSLPRALTTIVTPGYFETVGAPILRGRSLSAEDEPGAPRVTVVNEAAAARFWGGADPIGSRLRLAGEEGAPWFTVVGVVADTRNRGLDAEPDPEIFAVQGQAGGGNQLFLVLRTRGEPYAALPGVRETVAAMDPDQPVYAIQTLEQAFRATGSPRRAVTLFLGIFAAFALLLAATGVYAVVSFAVGERTREIGVRVALGAAPGRVRRMVVGQALLPVAAGIVAGAGLSVAAGRAMSGMLYGVRAGDPTTLAAVIALLSAVALVASWLPARRASRMEPSRALQAE